MKDTLVQWIDEGSEKDTRWQKRKAGDLKIPISKRRDLAQ